MNKPSVEVTEAEEGLYIFYMFRGRLLGDPCDFFRIHGYCSFIDYKAKIFDLGLSEEALFWLQI